MALKDSSNNWIDSGGNPIPPKYIKPLDKKRDVLVERLFAGAKKLQSSMKIFKGLVEELIAKHIEEIAKDTSLPPQWKGNLTLTGFSGTIQVEVDVKDYIVFDERLNVAKGLIDQYLLRKCDEANSQALRSIIHEAFNMDKKGRINRYMLRRLMRANIKDNDWLQAMDLIKESEQAVSSKQYVMFRYRDNPKGDWQSLSLNFASL